MDERLDGQSEDEIMAFWDGTRWANEMRTSPGRSPGRHRRLLGAAAEASLITLLTFGLIAGTTFAAKGGSGGGGKADRGGSIAIVVLDGADATANHTERVGFEVSTTVSDRPFVGVRCWQASEWVLDGYTGYFDTYMFDPWVTLDSPYWEPGAAADCSARLFYYDKRGNQKVLASIDFTAQPATSP